MTEIKNDLHLEAWRLFITLHAKLIELIDADLQAAGGIPLQHYDVLIELFEAEGKQLRMYELAQRVVLSRSSITRLVDQLAEQGLLTRRTDPADRRGSYAVLTETGEAALRGSWPIYRNAIRQRFDSFLTDEEAATMAQAFGRIQAAVE
ncbi:MAG: MarR family transcriptional regulator [Anaerolineae bacterium]|nr:MarR family transcriptional regulator [Anaerolineae bacterium]